MKSTLIKLFALLSIAMLAGCQQPPAHPLYSQSPERAPVEDYDSFSSYLAQTERYLSQNRYFLTNTPAAEIAANLPFELQPSAETGAPRKGVLLIHGLGDSPWSFTDIGRALTEQGYLVRTVLLPGHGTRPADMIDVSYKDWQHLVHHQVELLKNHVEEVYLGGFSTGGNLAFLEAARDKEVKGLMLFSPGFKSDEPLAGLTPLLSVFREWLLTADPDKTTNYARYTAMPTNGFAQYAHTSAAVLERLEKSTYNQPVVMVLSQHDSVLDTEQIKTLFNTKFTHPDSRLIWFGSQPSAIEGRIRFIHSRVPALRISTMSHMGVLFSPDNPYYGTNGTEKLCHNGQDNMPNAEDRCRQGKPMWYSAWGYQEPGKVHARLTFNPSFQTMMDDIATTFQLSDENDSQ